jgi:hypothetical protein
MQLKSDEYAACLDALEAKSPRELVELAEAVNECVNVGPLLKGEVVSVVRSNQFVRALVHSTDADVTPDVAAFDHREDKQDEHIGAQGAAASDCENDRKDAQCGVEGAPAASSQYNLLLEEEEGWIFASYKKAFSDPLTYSRSQIHARAPDLRQPGPGDTARRLFDLSGDEDETVATTDPECVNCCRFPCDSLCFSPAFFARANNAATLCGNVLIA